MVKLLSDQSTRPWAIVRILPKARYYSVACFRNRQDADDHVRVLRRFGCRSKDEEVTSSVTAFLEQWIAACRTLIHSCRNLPDLNALWTAILKEAERYTEEALSRLEAIWQQRYTYLSSRQ